MGEFIDYSALKEQIEKSGGLKEYLLSIPVEPISIPIDSVNTISASYFPPSSFVINGKTIEELIDERVEQYKELMRLQALGCKNCGGSINKETMTCEYCGTSYVLGNSPRNIAQYMTF